MSKDDNQNKPATKGKVIEAYQINSALYVEMMRTLQALPYNQVGNLMDACKVGVTPVYAEDDTE